MKKYFLHFPYDCLVINKDSQFIISAQQTLEIEETSLSLYPTFKGGVAFNIDLKNPADCEFYSCFEWDSQTHILLNRGTFVSTFTLSTQKVDDKTVNIEIGKRQVVFSSSTIKKCVLIDEDFEDFQTGVIEGFAYCLLGNKLIQNLLLFCPDGNFRIFKAEQIKINKNIILLDKSVDDFARHTTSEEYIVSGKEILRQEGKVSYVLPRAVTTSVPEVVPYAFMEAIKCCDFDLAYNYLDLQMKRKTSRQDLQDFFGEIFAFYFVSPFVCLVRDKGGKKVYNFKLNESKISEISQE